MMSLGRNTGLSVICLTLLLVKLVSIIVYLNTPYDVVESVLRYQSEDVVDYVDSIRESHSSDAVHSLGYVYDSVYYIEIAGRGYSREIYLTFPPGYPLLIRLVSLSGLDAVVSGILVSNLSHLFSVVLFYYVALLYVKKEHALLATALFAFYPYNLASGTVAYSDMVFMVFSLLSWIMLERKKYGWCGAMVFVASIVRFQGMLFYLIYSLIFLWRERKSQSLTKIKPLVELNISMLFILYWIFVVIPSSGSSLNMLHEKYWYSTLKYPFAILGYMTEKIYNVSHAIPFIAFISITALLAYQIKPEFGLYTLIFLLFYSSFTGATIAVNLGRYIGTIWPAYLYAGWKFGGTLKGYRLHYYVILFFVVVGVYLLLLHMNWIFVF